MKKKKILKFILLGVIICFVVFIAGDFVSAQVTVSSDKVIRDENYETGVFNISSNIAGFLSWITVAIIRFLGWLSTEEMKWVVKFFSIQDFNSDGVAIGWTVVRDICNMFFILVLLIIAFATILRMESYSAKKLLPKLLIMAVVINFSKAICFLLIDFSNVIMLNFAAAFTATGEANFIQMMGLQYIVDLQTGTSYELNSWNLLGALSFAAVLLAVVLIIMLMFVVILLARIVMFWILTILSPLAFLAYVIPGGQKYFSQWWGEFTRYLIVGPVLAFFTWLALTINIRGDVAANMGFGNEVQIENMINEMAGIDNMMRFLMGAALLIGALKIAQGIGGIGAGIGMSMAGKVKGGGVNLMNKGKTKLWNGTKSAANTGLATAKMADAAFNKGRGASAIQSIKSKGGAATGAATGAALGTMVLPGIGTAVGAMMGGLSGGVAGKKLSTVLDNKRRVQQARYDIKEEDGEKIYTDIDGKRHMKHEETGKFYQVNSDNQWISKEDGKIINESDLDKKGKIAKGAFGGEIKEMSEKGKDAWAAYSSSKGKGWALKDAAQEEKIDKSKNDYMGQSSDMLLRLLDIEKDSSKKMAISLALAVKEGFKDADSVKKAKDSFGGNGLLLKKFNDEMNKRNMVLNNTGSDGKIDEGAIAKLVSSGKAKWEDQDTKNMTADGYSVMAKQMGADFNKKLNSMLKTNVDRDNFSKRIEEGKGRELKPLRERGFNDEDLGIRKAYGSITGDYLEAFKKKDGGVDTGNLKNALGSISKTEKFGNIKKENLDDSDFQEAFSSSIDINTLRKISKSQDIDSEMIRKYMEIAARNEKLLSKMENDKELKDYF